MDMEVDFFSDPKQHILKRLEVFGGRLVREAYSRRLESI